MSIPEYPYTPEMDYLNAILGALNGSEEEPVLPDHPYTPEMEYLYAIYLTLKNGGGADSYNMLSNKPQINGVTLQGNKTTQELLIRATGNEAYDTYAELVAAVNALGADVRGIGDDVYCRETGVPDFWISAIAETSVPYVYTTDEALIAELTANKKVQMGYYWLSMLETKAPAAPRINVDDEQVQLLNLYSATLTLYEVGSTTPVTYKIYAEAQS